MLQTRVENFENNKPLRRRGLQFGTYFILVFVQFGQMFGSFIITTTVLLLIVI